MATATECPRAEWVDWTTKAIAVVLVAVLAAMILAPFLTGLSWALALALIGHPIFAWLDRRRWPRTLNAILIIFLVLAVLVGPGLILGRALGREAAQILNQVAAGGSNRTLEQALGDNRFFGFAWRWLEARIDLNDLAQQGIRAVAGWASSAATTVVTRSMWFMGQLGVTIFVLFYFLRDGEIIADKLRSLFPLPAVEVDVIFRRVAKTIRVSLGGKVVVAGIQGTLGGLIFAWLGLPAPVFWGTLMAALSVFPVIGAFVIWVPAAIGFILQGDLWRAMLLTGWGVLIIHPVDNLLGPVLVGATLRLHTLLMFFAVIGGIAAFGASGIVVGPVVVAVLVALHDIREKQVTPES